MKILFTGKVKETYSHYDREVAKIYAAMKVYKRLLSLQAVKNTDEPDATTENYWRMNENNTFGIKDFRSKGFKEDDRKDWSLEELCRYLGLAPHILWKMF